jgi:tetratricopeptide (TPR) repeat protein
VAIAEKWGARVHRSVWTESFAAARNKCLERVTGDWVLWLDAGERLSPKSAGQLRDFVDGNPDPKNAYLMMVEVPPVDRLASAEQIAQIRLVPRCAGLTFEGRIRENMLLALTAAGMEMETAPGRILRHPRQHDPARKEARARRNLALIHREKQEIGHEDLRLLLAEGDASGELQMNDESRAAFARVIEIAQPGSTAMLEGFYGLLSCYNNHPQLHDCQLELGLKALETYPFDVQLLLAMGSYLQGRNRIDLATRAFEIAVKFGQVDLAVWHLREVVEVSTACLCMAYQLQGRTSDACRELEEALKRHPRSERLRRHALDLYLKMDQVEKALKFAEQQAPLEKNRSALADAVRGACRAANADWLAALGYLQGAYLAGCRHPLCLRWLAVTLLAGGEIESARPVLEEWRKIEPNDPELLSYVEAIAEESTTAEEKISSSQPTSGTRQYRLDLGATATEISPLGLPIGHCFPSINTMLPMSNG